MSSERERRDFQAGLSEEVDAWLRGDTSKRTFLKRLVELGGATALARPGLALLGSGLGASFNATARYFGTRQRLKRHHVLESVSRPSGDAVAPL